jgi:hypothetical protein
MRIECKVSTKANVRRLNIPLFINYGQENLNKKLIQAELNITQIKPTYVYEKWLIRSN